VRKDYGRFDRVACQKVKGQDALNRKRKGQATRKKGQLEGGKKISEGGLGKRVKVKSCGGKKEELVSRNWAKRGHFGGDKGP